MLLIIELIILIILTLTISIFSFMQKGPLISALYCFSNQEERRRLRTKKRYYFIGTIFLTSALLFGIVLAEEIFSLPSIKKPLIIISIILVIYYIKTYTQLESERMKRGKNKD